VTADRISQLLRSIPPDVLKDFKFNVKRDVSPYIPWPDDDCERFAICYSDPAFGFKFVRTLVQKNMPMPGQLDGDDEILFRAYLYLSNPRLYRDENVIRALALTMPSMRASESKLQALLVSRDATSAKVGAILTLPERLVRTYEILFFNVLDRREDTIYLNQLVFPNGRLDEYFDAYLEGSSMRSLMMRAGIDNGVDEAAFLGGFNRSMIDGISAAQWGALTWDAFIWDGKTLAPSEIELMGTGENLSLRFQSSSDYQYSHKVHAAVVHWSQRRSVR